MNFIFSEKFRELTVYHFSNETGEFLMSETVPVPPHTGIPADSTLTPPPEEIAGKARVWDGYKWSYVTDVRGTTVYLKATGQEAIMNELGDLLDAWTKEPPPGQYVKWLNDGWVVDDDKELSALTEQAEQHKASLLNYADIQLKPLLYAEKLDMLTDDEKSNMEALMRHVVLVSRIDTSDPKNISWPELTLKI